MTAQIFGDGLNGDVSTQRKRLIKQTRAPGVVRREQNTMLMGEAGERGKIEDLVKIRTRRLCIDQLRVRLNMAVRQPIGGAEVAERHTQTRKQGLHALAHGTVHAIVDQYMIARRQETYEYQRYRR